VLQVSAAPGHQQQEPLDQRRGPRAELPHPPSRSQPLRLGAPPRNPRGRGVARRLHTGRASPGDRTRPAPPPAGDQHGGNARPGTAMGDRLSPEQIPTAQISDGSDAPQSRDRSVNQPGAVANSMPSKLAAGLPSTRIHPDLLDADERCTLSTPPTNCPGSTRSQPAARHGPDPDEIDPSQWGLEIPKSERTGMGVGCGRPPLRCSVRDSQGRRSGRSVGCHGQPCRGARVPGPSRAQLPWSSPVASPAGPRRAQLDQRWDGEPRWSTPNSATPG